MESMSIVMMLVITIVAALLILLNSIQVEKAASQLKICIISCIIFCAGMAIGVMGDTSPSAIDVYRGKTQLQITETTSSGKVIQRDSTVVYK